MRPPIDDGAEQILASVSRKPVIDFGDYVVEYTGRFLATFLGIAAGAVTAVVIGVCFGLFKFRC